MNKKLQALLDSINEKKALVQNLAEAGKISEATEAKAELVKLQAQFDLLKDIEDTVPEPQNPKPLKTPDNDSIAKFANAVRTGFRNMMTEGSNPDGGYTVPEDIETKIRKYRQACPYNLENLVTVEHVKTESGARTYQKRGRANKFSKVGEGKKIGAADTPQFERLTYAINKYAGFIPVTNELLADTDEALTQFIIGWMGDGSIATRNSLILEALAAAKTAESDDSPTYTVFDNMDDIETALNTTLGAAYKSTSVIYTNNYGVNALSQFKDANGRSLLTPVPSEPNKMQLSCGSVIVRIEEIPDTDMPNIELNGKIYPPLIAGDFKEAVVFYDRQKMSMKVSTEASAGGLNAFEEDLTLFRAIEREDVKVKDDEAYVYGYLNQEVKTLKTAKKTA